MRWERLCTGEDCFSVVKLDEFTACTSDGKPHRVEQLCHKCRTEADERNLKNFKKRQRRKINKKGRYATKE